MEEVVYNNTVFKVINDGTIYPYGTKQRVISQYLDIKVKNKFRTFIYAGPSDAMGAIALANGIIELLDKGVAVKGMFFLVGKFSKQLNDMVKRRNSLGYKGKVNFIPVQSNLNEAFSQAEEYEKKSRYNMRIPFGIEDLLYSKLLYTSLNSDFNSIYMVDNTIGRMWIASGSGTILRVLMKILPNFTFNVVLPGTKRLVGSLTEEEKSRITIYECTERFTQPAKVMPPFKALANYDAKIWGHAIEHGISGDYIFIVV